MFDSNMEDLKARVTPYTDFKERVRIINKEIEDGGKVEFDESFIYSFKQ